MVGGSGRIASAGGSLTARVIAPQAPSVAATTVSWGAIARYVSESSSLRIAATRTVRDRVLKAAATCFNHKGFSGTSLKDVSKHLNLTDAALYYYVRNKEELVYL